MYESFFGFKEKPFNLNPDPRYLYPSPSHREALAHLVYGIQEKRGFMVITGEVGTGKTTLLHTLLEQHDSSIKAAFVFYPKLSFHDFLLYVLDNFGLQTTAVTAAQGLTQLRRFLLEQHNKGETTVLVIDEAQNLPISLLEEIRMLSNLETSGEKLLQIALVGQPELQRKLRSPRLRQLRQRIDVIYEICPLSYAEMQNYIQHRCAVAGRAEPTLFTRRALKAIYAYSGGIPRLINTACDRALLTGYAEARRQINRKIARQVVRELEVQPRRSVLTPPVRGAAMILAGLLLLGVALSPVRGLSFVSTAFTRLQASLLHVQHLFKGQRESSTPSIAGSSVSLENAQPAIPDDALQHEEVKERTNETQERLEDGTKDVITSQTVIENKSGPEKDTDKTVQNQISNKVSQPQKQTFPVMKTMKEGDYISKYAVEIYGYSNNSLIAWLHKHNPHIKDMARVKVGETVIFPVLDTLLE
jgi:putative secretion ATPase (PEP-CTERM system associated)